MLKKGDIVEYDDTSKDAWVKRKGSIGIVREDEYNGTVGVSRISGPDLGWDKPPIKFFSTVWKKIGHSE